MRNPHRIFDWHYIGQIYGGDFAKFCGLLKICISRENENEMKKKNEIVNVNEVEIEITNKNDPSKWISTHCGNRFLTKL